MKKVLSLFLALVMVLSCVFVLASCKDDDEGDEKSKSKAEKTESKYDGKYFFEDIDFTFLMGGEDMTELLGDDFVTEEGEDYVEIKGGKMYFSPEEPGDDPIEASYEEKDGKLKLSKQDELKVLGDITEEFGSGGEAELYFKVNGDKLTMYISVIGTAEGISYEISVTTTFKK